MRGSAGGLEKLSAGVSGLVKKPLDCTVALVYEIRFFTNFNLQMSAFWDIIIFLTIFPYYH